MQLRLPSSVSEAQRCLADGAVPIGGATLVWAGWQRDGFPEQAVSLRDLPEANAFGPEELGGAVPLHRVDATVPEVLHRAASGVGTGAVRRAATVGGNIVGSTLRCLLPAALVLDARATVLTADGVYETDLAELLAKRHVLLALRWRTPLVSGYRKLPGETGGPPPLVVAVAVHADGGAPGRVRVAVRDGYEVVSESTPYRTDAEQVLRDLADTTALSLPAPAQEALRREVADVLARAAA
ncbi:FAD binding domain-containing protein [Streptomyces hilarionis]|uniref:FAD binding domain-containing protein n=1 Tax=Streptomyces hilarionis TaxID=2839954 RepID=UPI002119ED95|nr:FAD binding domain-containing protein [Streptomyces hilarionis]MCQ9132756.1 FAD binding domain-containing protein [Streptomyces hilarionis]